LCQFFHENGLFVEINPKGDGTGRARRISAPRERGVALIMVLGFIIVLAVMATAFATNMQVEARLARKSKNDVKVEWICRSGIELAKYILAQQMANAQEPYDSLNQKWAGYSDDDPDDDPNDNSDDPGFNQFLDSLDLNNSAWAENSILGLIFPDRFEFEDKIGIDARCSIQIVDLERKFNINRAAEDSMGRFPLEKTFELMEVNTGLSPYLVDAIKDWRDTDDLRRVSGAESDTYETKIPPYTAKNGPIDDLKELLLVEGMTPEIYWGSRAKQIAANPLHAPTATVNGADEDEEIIYPFGMADIFTPISSGFINLNTASSEVMQLVAIDFDKTRLDKLVQLRAETDGGGTGALISVGDMQRAGFTPLEAKNAERFFTVISTTFEVTVQAQVGKLSRTLVAVITRPRTGPKDIKILYTYWK
jgi:type II secretory pathway component PulK